MRESGVSVRVRMATRADVMAMVEIERGSPTAANWSHQHYQSLFSTEASGSSGYFVVVVENESAGSCVPIMAYLAAHYVNEEWELQYVAVAPEFQRRGVGAYALAEFIDHARRSGGARIFLEVRQSNQAARALYRKLGFEETGLRKSYYSNPLEDAIICRLTL